MTRALLCLAIAASPAIASTPTVEVVGYTDTGEPCGDGYPRELDDAELDEPMPAFDEDERRIPGEYTSVREMLDEHGDTPGWLAGSRW